MRLATGKVIAFLSMIRRIAHVVGTFCLWGVMGTSENEKPSFRVIGKYSYEYL